MTIHWLPWSGLPVPAVADHLFSHGDRARASGECDLSSITLILPGRRAERLVLWHLLERAESVGLALVPPATASTGALVDLLAPPLARVAGADERELAIAAALMASGARASGPFPVLRSADPDAFRAVATLIRTMEDRLDAAGVGIGDAAAHCLRAERSRWRSIVATSEAAANLLEAEGYALPWTVGRSDVPAVQRLVLAMQVEMPARARSMVRDAAGRGVEVTALVHAPESMCDAFDEIGVLRPGAWTGRHVGIDLARITVANRAIDAASLVVGAALHASRSHDSDEIVVGLADPSLGPSIELAGAWAGVPVRCADGRSITQTQCWLLIEALAKTTECVGRNAAGAITLTTPGVDRLVALPAVAAWLKRVGVVESAADVSALVDSVHAGRSDDGADMISKTLDRALAPLRSAPRSLPEWAEPIRAVLSSLLSAAPSEHPDDEAIAAIGSRLESWSRIPRALAPLPIPASAALGRLAADLEDARLPEPVRPDTLDALGWLELHADDAPVLLILGLHEGAVPARDAAHPLLTPRIARELGLPDEAQRLARDAYLLEAMTQGREIVKVVVARRTPTGDPALPSRLLLEGEPSELPKRVLTLLAGDRAVRVDRMRGMPDPRALSGFVVPPVDSTPPPESMRVTDFRRYLACPYRYRLARLLGLEPFVARSGELDALEFGTLVHDVLCAFGADATMRDCTDPDRIETALAAALDAAVTATFTAGPSVQALVQVAQLRRRLAAFARWQAAHRLEGWRIRETEMALPDDALLQLPAAHGLDAQPPMPVRGRIDRIDEHPEHGLLVIDYKTSANGADPRATHLGSTRADGLDPDHWRDLQLPLYRHLITASIGGDVPIATAYVQLPRNVEATGLMRLEVADDAHEVAIGVARRIVRAIRANEFPRADPFVGIDDFAAICHANAFVVGGEPDFGGDEEPAS